jgi:non-heme chloroperoxidase
MRIQSLDPINNLCELKRSQTDEHDHDETGTQIDFKDWGSGQPVVFSHGWPLSADAWEDQMVFLGNHGYRYIAHDRRGHGRSSQPWIGNEMDLKAQVNAELLAFLRS